MLFKLFWIENDSAKSFAKCHILFKYIVLYITVFPRKDAFLYYRKNQISFYKIFFWCHSKSNSK